MANKRIIDFNQKTTPVDTDRFLLWSDAETATRSITGANMKAYIADGIGVTPAGTNGSIQINTGGNLAAVNGFIWNTGDSKLEVPGLIDTVSDGSSNQWNEAYNVRITGVTGTTASTLSLTRPNTSNLSLNHTHANLSTGDGLTGTTYNGSADRQFSVDTAWDAIFASLTAGGDVKSDDFTSDILDGNGYRLQKTDAAGKSNLEVDNIRVRNEFRTHIFRKEIVKAMNGRFYISDVSEVGEDKALIGGSSTTLKVKAGTAYATFSPGDRLLVRNIGPNGITINNVTMEVISTSVVGGTNTLSVDILTSGNVYEGDTIVRTSGGTVYMDATSANSPFVDVRVNNVMNTRMGNLAGVSNATGWGIYGENAYLTGAVVIGDLTKTNEYISYENGNITMKVADYDLDSKVELDAGEPDNREVRLRIRNVEDSTRALAITTTPIDAGVPQTPIDKIVFTRDGDATFAGDVDLEGDMTVNGSIITDFDDGNFIRGVRIEDGQLITSLNGNDLGFIRTFGAEFRSGTAGTSAKTTISTTAMIVDSNPTLDPENNPNYTGFSIATGIDVRQFAQALRPAHRDGRIVYNSTSNKLQVSVNGSWVNLN